MGSSKPRITFGMIVLNGEPFIRYNLRSLYPFAHEIIVVEGAAPAAENISKLDGHSRDGTLDTLLDFKANEDPDGKLTIVTAEDEGHINGFWPGEKHEQCRAFAHRASGDYLWQVDVDEFYKPEDVQTIIEMLQACPDIAAMSFSTLTFWGGLDYLVDGWYLRRGEGIFHRLFKWGPKYQYISHRPPTVLNSQGKDIRNLFWINGDNLAKNGIYLYHYSLLFPKQVIDKSDYYQRAEWVKNNQMLRWAKQNYQSLSNPYQVHNVYTYPSWLQRYTGDHPPQILNMWEDIKKGAIVENIRSKADIENLLDSPEYVLGRGLIKGLDYIDRLLKGGIETIKQPYRLARKIWRQY